MATFLKERGFLAGYAVTLAGVLLLVAGFVVDAVLHAQDPDLAEREGVFTLSNPGHLLVVVGLAGTILGICIGPYSHWVLGRGSAVLAALVPVLALAAAISASSVLAVAINDLDHEHASSHTNEAATQTAPDLPGEAASTSAADGAHSHGDGEASAGAGTSVHETGHVIPILPKHSATIALEELTFVEPPNDQPVTDETIRFADQFLADVKRETAKYQDVSVALAAGYTRITPDLPLIGAHFYNGDYVGSLDPAKPAIILYRGDDSRGWEMVGVAFLMPNAPGDDPPPVTPLGGLAHWHYHTNLCFLAGGIVGIAQNERQCAGVFVAETPWLLHVWSVVDSPEGVFNHANSLLQ